MHCLIWIAFTILASINPELKTILRQLDLKKNLQLAHAHSQESILHRNGLRIAKRLSRVQYSSHDCYLLFSGSTGSSGLSAWVSPERLAMGWTAEGPEFESRKSTEYIS
jgi:hypothetical protein